MDQQNFNLYNVIPMPLYINNTQFAYVQFTYDYIAISPSKEYYTTFLPQQINACKQIANCFICYVIQPIHSKSNNNLYEISLFNKQFLPL